MYPEGREAVPSKEGSKRWPPFRGWMGVPPSEVQSRQAHEACPDAHRADKERKQGPINNPRPLVAGMFTCPPPPGRMPELKTEPSAYSLSGHVQGWSPDLNKRILPQPWAAEHGAG